MSRQHVRFVVGLLFLCSPQYTRVLSFPNLGSGAPMSGILKTLSQIDLPGAWIFLDVDTRSRFVTTVY